MKKYLIALFALTLFAGCGSATKTDITATGAKSDVTSLEFKKEGFVSRDRYISFIIKPSDTGYSESEITEQLKNRTISSLQKYLQESGKQISPKAKSGILNIVNDYGTTKKIKDDASSRIIYVYEINHDNLKGMIDSL